MSLISRIKAYFAPSVDRAIADLQGAVKRLEAAYTHHVKAAASHAAAAEQSLSAAEASKAESIRAANIADKIKALVS